MDNRGIHEIREIEDDDANDVGMGMLESGSLDMESQSQTQNFEQTQQFEDSQQSFSFQDSNLFSPQTPINPLTIPWGRLVPQNGNSSSTIQNVELLPRRPLQFVGSATRSRSISMSESPIPENGHGHGNGNVEDGIDFIGLKHIKVYDRFNEYVIGRSLKSDIAASKRENVPINEKWVHSMISNTHCRIFCMLKGIDANINVNVNVNANADIHNRLSTSGEMSMSTAEMEVYIEDSSGNGTLVNNITLLRKNERRILHTGDTICLINPKIIQKKMRNALLQKKIIEHYSFVFINTHQTQRGATATHTMGNISSGLGMGTIVQSSIDGNHNHNHNHNYNHNSNNKAAQTRTPISSRIGIRSCQQPSTTSSRKRGLVDVKGTKSIQRPTGTGTSTLAIDMMMPPPDKKLKIHYYSSSEFTSKPKSKPKSMGQSKSSLRQLEAEYDLRDELGSGTCGLVRRAIHRKSGKMVAVKIIAIGGAGGRNRSVLSSKKFEIDPIIQAEANILKQLDHPYIVKLVDMFINPGKAVYLVMELLHGGDLFDRIVSKGRYTEVESRRVTRRMLAAVHYLHVDRDVVHRDLKPENILCVSQQDNITVKLTDFGLAKSITDDGLKTFCGTPQYFAPEVLRRQNTVAGRGRYGKEADMWSLGIILYILLSGIPPFDGSDMDAVAAAKISFGGSRWEGISDSAKDLIRQMLAIDANKRISVVDSCSHEWIMTQDGDTHVYPLDDPAIQRVIKAKDKVHTRSEVNKTPEQQNTTQPKPQSIITENLSPGPTTDIRPCSAKEKTLAANQDNKSDEIPTPNQSANFATSPIDGPGITESPKKQRESLFSFVKQLSDESACIRMQTKLETTVDVLEVENEQKDGNEVKILAVGEGREANELVEETQASDPKLRSPKSSAKQTTLSSWFGKK